MIIKQSVGSNQTWMLSKHAIQHYTVGANTQSFKSNVTFTIARVKNKTQTLKNI